MSTLNEILTFEHESEHNFAHDLEHNLAHKTNFSTPKIYDAKGDLKKRWYVYFSYRNPETGKLQRMKNIYGTAHLYKTKEDRLAVLSKYRIRLLKLLRQGYNPFADNTALFQSKNPGIKVLNAPAPPKPIEEIQPEDKPILPETAPKLEKEEKTEVISQPIAEPKEEGPVPQIEAPNETFEEEEKVMTVKEALNFGMELKGKIVKPATLQGYSYSVNIFIKWIEENRPKIKTIDQVNKKVAMDFLNHILLTSSSRNRNNYRLNLSSIMQLLEDNDIIISNPMKKIPVMKTKPNRNKTYTKEKQEAIFEYLEKYDPILLLYIKFVSYNFLRPIEVNRLKIKDINLKSKTLQFEAKNKVFKTKLIPEILIADLPDLSNMDPEHYLFTPDAIGAEWDASETNRRDNFSKRFKAVKRHFGLDSNYGLYSFRHTFITQLYRALVKNSTPFAAKSALMEITGHTTMDALEKYLRDIDASLPNDYSHLLQKANDQ
ncbi:tyrosine-type recombinase/integrase [Mangrovimonas sp. YM274]|uniref:tyrosine-type recombinase/integrase n=1 Tax=Mangrovimonas sp. YM274 TaxID=3070660 RepID=UPI0027DE5D0D|nr:tyrosine-type recombinase/integrase [Mangrovimonas sp. YM274]WMI70086.1 tyrosine-type recombinase/integrase [Mangrovimonas sp. YM274]